MNDSTGEVAPVLVGRKDNWHVHQRAKAPQRPAPERVRDFCEIYLTLDPETARREAARCVACAEPQCAQYCPLGNRITEWLELTAEGKFLEAAAVSQSTSPFPEICSRVCPQERLCERGCVISAKGEAAGIGLIERFINEYAFSHGGVDTRPRPIRHLQPVAVVGSGPAGLACADALNQRGYPVTVYEAAPAAGGLLLYGIPGFKLEKEVVQRRVAVLEKRGIQFRCGIRIGDDIPLMELFHHGFQAIYLAIGAQAAKEMEIAGRELEGVYQALPFLVRTQAAAGIVPPVPHAPPIPLRGRRVVVLGGGDTAMDCLRTSIRLGARAATCVYRRDQANMPGSKKEFVNATAEGAEFLWLANPVRIHGNPQQQAVRVECQPMMLGEPDAKGRRSPVPAAAPRFFVEADVVVIAFGFDRTPLTAGGAALRTTRWGTFAVDANGMTNVPGIFAGGDCVNGADLVVTAARAGRDAATSMDQFLAAKRESASPAVALKKG